MTNHTYTTSLEISIAGNDTKEIGICVNFSYTPKSDDYYDKAMGCWYPGDGEEIEIMTLSLYDIDDPKTSLDCPGWISNLIEASISHDNLREAASADHDR